jgi:hypothetical protein
VARTSVLQALRLSTASAVAWAFRMVWGSLPFTGAAAFGRIFTDATESVGLVGSTGLWLGWILVLTASLVPTTVALTVVRLVSPGAVVAAFAAAARHASGLATVAAIAVSIVAIGLVFSAEFGGLFVQGSAYGDESRFPLRPPGPLVVAPLPLGWALTFAAVVAGPLMLAARLWLVGSVVTVVGVALAWLFGRRCHRLSRRFLVLVPAGIVVHDHLVLSDTSMFRKSEVATVGLALDSTEAADLTGKALGNAVEIALKDFDTVVLAGTPKKPGGTALHVKAVLVSPTRPGRVLAEAARRGHRIH